MQSVSLRQNCWLECRNKVKAAVALMVVIGKKVKKVKQKFAKPKIMLTFVIQSHRGVEQLVARRAHNPEAGGSSPSPATRMRLTQKVSFFVYKDSI